MYYSDHIMEINRPFRPFHASDHPLGPSLARPLSRFTENQDHLIKITRLNNIRLVEEKEKAVRMEKVNQFEQRIMNIQRGILPHQIGNLLKLAAESIQHNKVGMEPHVATSRAINQYYSICRKSQETADDQAFNGDLRSLLNGIGNITTKDAIVTGIGKDQYSNRAMIERFHNEVPYRCSWSIVTAYKRPRAIIDFRSCAQALYPFDVYSNGIVSRKETLISDKTFDDVIDKVLQAESTYGTGVNLFLTAEKNGNRNWQVLETNPYVFSMQLSETDREVNIPTMFRSFEKTAREIGLITLSDRISGYIKSKTQFF